MGKQASINNGGGEPLFFYAIRRRTGNVRRLMAILDEVFAA